MYSDSVVFDIRVAKKPTMSAKKKMTTNKPTVRKSPDGTELRVIHYDMPLGARLLFITSRRVCRLRPRTKFLLRTNSRVLFDGLCI